MTTCNLRTSRYCATDDYLLVDWRWREGDSEGAEHRVGSARKRLTSTCELHMFDHELLLFSWHLNESKASRKIMAYHSARTN